MPGNSLQCAALWAGRWSISTYHATLKQWFCPNKVNHLVGLTKNCCSVAFWCRNFALFELFSCICGIPLCFWPIRDRYCVQFMSLWMPVSTVHADTLAFWPVMLMTRYLLLCGVKFPLLLRIAIHGCKAMLIICCLAVVHSLFTMAKWQNIMQWISMNTVRHQ